MARDVAQSFRCASRRRNRTVFRQCDGRAARGHHLACAQIPSAPPAPSPASAPALAAEDDAFLEDLSRRTFMFFWDQADPATGIVRDRSRTDGPRPAMTSAASPRLVSG